MISALVYHEMKSQRANDRRCGTPDKVILISDAYRESGMMFDQLVISLLLMLKSET